MDGIINFTGIDWHSNGTGYVQGFDLTSCNTTGDTDTFTFTFQAFAGIINGGSPTPNLRVAPPGSAVGTYELTTIAVVNETATCQNVGCSHDPDLERFGNLKIYFDNTPKRIRLPALASPTARSSSPARSMLVHSFSVQRLPIAGRSA